MADKKSNKQAALSFVYYHEGGCDLRNQTQLHAELQAEICRLLIHPSLAFLYPSVRPADLVKLAPLSAASQ